MPKLSCFSCQHRREEGEKGAAADVGGLHVLQLFLVNASEGAGKRKARREQLVHVLATLLQQSAHRPSVAQASKGKKGKKKKNRNSAPPPGSPRGCGVDDDQKKKKRKGRPLAG